ncbi:MAG: chaperone protein DnaJ [uncultured bacterium (gcode 4)]|uniref:Chaperone protein DnaJ n=1 Tax=uncultured bacterium (gcode 4) TaxID=1234023 RepID=K2GGS8_9BACT|nr:MAG: chaperone protein DnaJ [uncultured bacterium (gcode 4)]
MSDNYYDLLGVDKNANPEEIKKAYRKKAMELHPDRHGWDKQKETEFKKINEAYSILSDAQKKAHYDRFGSAEWMWGFSQGWFGWADFDISDIFESFFWWNFSQGWWSRRKKDESGEDLEMNVKLDFSEAIFGGKKTLKFEKRVVCGSCKWSWAKAWTSAKACGTCGWTWQVKRRTQSFFWVIEQASVCPTCGWNWTIVESPCTECWGKKRIGKKTEKEIDIPAWIDDGMSIKMKWEWNEWTNGRNWDLYITFSVPDSFEWLKRDEDNLHIDLGIDPVEAVLGAKRKVKVPLLWDRQIEIKPGTQDGDIIKFKWDWVKNVSRDIKWDLFLHVIIKVPTHLSKRERELYEEIAKEKWIDFADHKWIFWKIFW